MNLDELRTVQSKERSKDSLQHLRESFYADVADYVADLRERRDRAAERAADPFADPEVSRLTDELKTAEEVVEGLYERRVGKVVKRASLSAMGVAGEAEGLTAEEQELFDDLVDQIETNKREVLDVLAGDEPARSKSTSDNDADPTPTPGDAAPTSSEVGAANASADGDANAGDASASDVSPADVMGGDGAAVGRSADSTASDGPQSADVSDSAESDASASRPNAEAGAVVGEGAATDSTAEGGETTASGDAPTDEDAGGDADPLVGLAERTTVRVTDDVGEIFGVDERTYDLASEDVVTLPEANAEPLLEQGAAEKLD